MIRLHMLWHRIVAAQFAFRADEWIERARMVKELGVTDQRPCLNKAMVLLNKAIAHSEEADRLQAVVKARS